jgi:hypothetical protein
MAVLIFVLAWGLLSLILLAIITALCLPKPRRARAFPRGARIAQGELNQAHRLHRALDGGAQ